MSSLQEVMDGKVEKDILEEKSITLLRCKNGYQICVGALAGSAIGTEHSYVCESIDSLLAQVRRWALAKS